MIAGAEEEAGTGTGAKERGGGGKEWSGEEPGLPLDSQRKHRF